VIVIGAGRVGTALADRAAAAGVPCTLIDREHGWDALLAAPGAPILITTRNDDLGAVIDRVPRARHNDLVCVQNGAIRELLASRFLPHVTRGILYFAVPAKGAPIEPGRSSPFCGPHAYAVAEWFVSLDLDASVLGWAQFSSYELEKMIWLAAFGAMGDAYGEDVGTVATNRVGELAIVVEELRCVGRAVMGVDLDLDALMHDLIAYSMSIPRFRAGVREFTWRNGWFMAKGADYHVDQPAHVRLLQVAGHWPS
jgi:hypothetical protein